jgi:hypothetical protein
MVAHAEEPMRVWPRTHNPRRTYLLCSRRRFRDDDATIDRRSRHQLHCTVRDDHVEFDAEAYDGNLTLFCAGGVRIVLQISEHLSFSPPL